MKTIEELREIERKTVEQLNDEQLESVTGGGIIPRTRDAETHNARIPADYIHFAVTGGGFIPNSYDAETNGGRIYGGDILN